MISMLVQSRNTFDGVSDFRHLVIKTNIFALISFNMRSFSQNQLLDVLNVDVAVVIKSAIFFPSFMIFVSV